MKIILCAVVAVLAITRVQAGETKLYLQCYSLSGLSIYDVELDKGLGAGEVRYRFMGQDIFYKLYITSGDNSIVKGVAEYQSSRTGETKGRPWAFQFNPATMVLMDNEDVRQCK